MRNNIKRKLLVIGLKKHIKNLVNQKVWVNKEGDSVKVSEMPNHYLLFAHRFLVNEINSLDTLNDSSQFDDEIFKLLITSMEGVGIFLEEIKFRNLIAMPSNVEVQINSNELLKSENDLSFKK